MRRWLSGTRGGIVAFMVLTALVAGGLGWATRAALRMRSLSPHCCSSSATRRATAPVPSALDSTR